jgi:hypothetical protein
MRTLLLGICILVTSSLFAQRECATSEYFIQQKSADASLLNKAAAIENFIQNQTLFSAKTEGEGANVIRIPVVVHVLYNVASQNISDAQIKSQIDALNRDFRKQNFDTINTPTRFKSFSADVQIEFVLATADPMGRYTNGVVRKHTDVAEWKMDDKIKYSSQGGDDAWDSRYYLNFWVGSMKNLLGYASSVGCTADKDGVVISPSAFGTINISSPYNMGRTAVHEVGHWLGLKHIWGDTFCGDDAVDDTPKQGNFTSGCPNSFRSSCTNGTMGDMYMNYMDYTSDACMNLFTKGQKQRMLFLFNAGGPRNTFLISKGLNTPWTEAAPVVIAANTEFKFYPNPAVTELTLNFQYDADWIGKTISVVNINGIAVSKMKITEKNMKINLTSLKPGVYFIQGNNGGKKISAKFIRL